MTTGKRERATVDPRLSTYRTKRNAAATPEPMGKAGSRRVRAQASGPSFVIQEHHARALHWDFRLEHDGVLVSWALPKGLPEDPATNHLAVHTEDHPLEYGTFAGDIPAGEYGAGEVKIWDHGTFELEKWTEREVKVVLHGERAEGRYVLFPTRDKNWMIHRMDPPPRDYEPMPERIAPMLAVTGPLPRNDAGWVYEFKWDGVRAIVFVDGGRVRAFSRNDKDLAGAFPELGHVGEFLGSRRAVLDGEIVAFDDSGRPSFGQLQQRLHLTQRAEITRRARQVPASFLVFDLLYLEGRSLLAATYEERRTALESLALNGESFATPPSFTDRTGADVLAAAREGGLEGVVAKRRDSPYRPGSRSGEWVKIKNFRTQEVVIGGWTEGRGGRSGSLGALVLGLPSSAGLTYAGKVGTGFDDATRRQLLDDLRPLEQDTSPFSTRLPPSVGSPIHYVRPELVGEVRYGEWTRDGHLRHPSWRGLRPDKQASEVVREP